MHGEGRSGQRRVIVMLQPVSITGGKKACLLLSHTFIKEDNEAAARADASF